MKIKKKAIALLCTLCTVASLTTPVLAAEATTPKEMISQSTLTETASNYYISDSAYISELTASIERKGGLFYCQGNAFFKGYQNAYMIVTLEKEHYSRGWETVKTWYSDTPSSGNMLNLKKSTIATPGQARHRCYVEVRVLNSTGQEIERRGTYSNVLMY